VTAGTNMVPTPRRAREVFRFIRINSPDYLESRFRLLTAWGIGAGWLVTALAGLVCARRAEGADSFCELDSASAARPRGD